MNYLLTNQTQILLLILLCAVLWSAESVIPLYRNEQRVRHAVPNVALATLIVLTNVALSAGIAYIPTLAASSHFGLFASLRVPGWMQLALGVLVLDLFAYVAHVLLHKSWFGWQFHRIHHSEKAVDVTTAFRQHPGETVWRFFWRYLAVFLLALPFWVVVVYVILSTAHAQFEHANIRLPIKLDTLLRHVVVTPDMHKVHHSRLQIETDSNYGNIFSGWDKLFGTYTRRTDFNTLRYGLDGFDNQSQQTIRALLGTPFKP